MKTLFLSLRYLRFPKVFLITDRALLGSAEIELIWKELQVLPPWVIRGKSFDEVSQHALGLMDYPGMPWDWWTIPACLGTDGVSISACLGTDGVSIPACLGKRVKLVL